jgi:hypothetical protein
MLRMFRRFTHAPVALVTANTPIAGKRAAIPRRKLSDSTNMATPVIRNRLLTNCIKAWATN